MSELENREFLRAILELLKTQMIYVRNLHDAFGALYEALVRDHPQLEENHRAEMEKIRLNPDHAELEKADALLQLLREVPDVDPVEFVWLI